MALHNRYVQLQTQFLFDYLILAAPFKFLWYTVTRVVICSNITQSVIWIISGINASSIAEKHVSSIPSYRCHCMRVSEVKHMKFTQLLCNPSTNMQRLQHWSWQLSFHPSIDIWVRVLPGWWCCSVGLETALHPTFVLCANSGLNFFNDDLVCIPFIITAVVWFWPPMCSSFKCGRVPWEATESSIQPAAVKATWPRWITSNVSFFANKAPVNEGIISSPMALSPKNL